MIRLATPNDATALIAVAEASGLFEPNQTEELAQMLSQHFNAATNSHDFWFIDDDNGGIGVAYAAPERMTEGTWNLYLIAIHPDRQRQGRGRALLVHLEQILAERGERVLLVETSGTTDFEHVRAFYQNNGYEQEARIRDFYTEGVDKIVFRKKLNKSIAQR